MHLVYYCLVNSLNFQILLQSKELWRDNEIPFNYLIYAKDINYKNTKALSYIIMLFYTINIVYPIINKNIPLVF